MPHAFRSAATIEAEAAQKKLDRLRERWASTRDTWFDGTADSVDRRIAWVDEVIGVAKHTASRLYASQTGAYAMSLLPQLRADRQGLEAARAQLLGQDTGLITGPEEVGLQPLSPETVTDMRNNISNWNSDNDIFSSRHAAIPGPEEAGIKHLPPERVREMRDERKQWRDDDDDQVKQAARDFIESQNTDDREELLIRAQRLVETRTSSWEPDASRAAVRDFLGAVSAQIPRRPRTAAAPVQQTVEDFEDHLMFS